MSLSLKPFHLFYQFFNFWKFSPFHSPFLVKHDLSCLCLVTQSHLWLFATLCSSPWNCPWNSPGKNSGVGSHSLLEGIFLNHGLNPSLLHCRRILHCPSHWGSPFCFYSTSIDWRRSRTLVSIIPWKQQNSPFLLPSLHTVQFCRVRSLCLWSSRK